MANDELSKAYQASRNAKAPVRGKKQSNASAILAGARSVAPKPKAEPAPEKPKDWWEQTTENVGKALDVPVIKQIIDAISVGTYSAGNVSDEAIERKKRMQEGKADFGDILKEVVPQAASIEGFGKGLQASFLGNNEYKKTQGEAIRKVQEMSGIDPNSSESKWVAGLGGFAADVATDPLTYLTGGGATIAKVKGATRGAIQYKPEARMAAKEGQEIAAGVENTRWANAKKQANIEAEKYKKFEETHRLTKEAKKNLRGKDARQSAAYLIENLTALDSAVAKALVQNKKVKEGLEAKNADGTLAPETLEAINVKINTSPVDEAAETVAKADEAEAVEQAIKGRKVGLSEFKPPTVAEEIWHKLSKLTTPKKTAIYSDDVIKNVETQRAARPDNIEEWVSPAKAEMTPENQVVDVNTTIARVKAYDKAMTSPKNPGGAKFRVGNRYADAKEMISALKFGPKDAEFQKYWDALDPATQVYKAPEAGPPVKKVTKNPKALTDDELVQLGIRPEHIESVRKGTKLSDLTDDTLVGDIPTILKNIKDGIVPDSVVKQFYEVTGKTDRAEVAKALKAITDSKDFKEVHGELKKYGSVRTGETPAPTMGVSGHGKFALPNKNFSKPDIDASKTPATPEQAQAFLEADYTEKATNLAGLTIGGKSLGVELREAADWLFEGTIDTQRRPAGPRRAKGGASVTAKEAPKQGAKYETQYNTHSTIWRMEAAIKHARQMERDGVIKGRSQMDRVIMTLLDDVDARLRLAGFDQHLSNMQVVGDKLIVRLAPSDVLNAMTQADRIKYIWGNKIYSKDPASELNEFLPTTILDLAEVLVRSATKLTKSGEVDIAALKNNALLTLQGRYSEVAKGKRVIISNLDNNIRIKNEKEILKQLDEDAFKQYDAAVKDNKPAKQKAIMDSMIALHGDKFAEISSKRLDQITQELVDRFTKESAKGVSPITQLINTNMRNASLAGGNVARPVGEALAEYSAKVLETLDNGTLGDHLSALVSRPPFPTTDKAVKAVIDENRTLIQNSAATPEEVRHAQASNKNVEGAENGPKVNAEAYQKDTQLVDEMAKPADEINTDKVFDLAIRERNKDMLYRLYGTSRFFNKRTGMPISFDVLAGSTHASALLMTTYHEILRDLVRKGYSNEQLRVAFNSLKEGPPADQIAAELNGVLSTMFDTSKTNFLSRNSVGPQHLNEVMESVGFDMDKFRIPENATPYEMMNIWKTWDVTDVKDFFSKMMSTMVKVSEDVSMGASFTKHFGSEVAKPGYVKLVDTTKKANDRNPFFDLINKDLYYPEEVANEMVHIGRLLTESRSFTPKSKLYTFVTKIMDPTISNLKMTQTTMKPGHHVMSIIGDTWRNNLALTTIGVFNPAKQTQLYFESARILWAAVGDIEELSAFQKFTRAQQITNELVLAKESRTKVAGKFKGTDTGAEYFPNIGGGGNIGRKDLYSIMQANGVALPAHLGGMAEDFAANFDTMSLGEKSTSKIAEGVGKVTRGLDRLANPIKPKFGMKNPYSLNKFTANRDTWTRGALFLGAMRSRNFASVEEAVKYSAEFVRKWAPTAVDLGAAEAKYLRRGIFYYTWIRGMVPRIIESTLMRPGIASIPNKAMYNLAIANGIDPNSIGDPFPEGTLFPSWYTERVIGPQYKVGNDLWGGNPTGPLGDILNTVGSNIKPKDFMTGEAFMKTAGTVWNMSTPFIKAPIEFTTGRTLETGAPIDDRAQYLQDYIGPMRFASRTVGKEMYPSIGPEGIAQANRTESKYREGMTPDETTKNALPEILNYLTGLGFTNYTSDSAQKSAEFQEKDKLIKAKKEAERFQ